jgi:hypothetical protein
MSHVHSPPVKDEIGIVPCFGNCDQIFGKDATESDAIHFLEVAERDMELGILRTQNRFLLVKMCEYPYPHTPPFTFCFL